MLGERYKITPDEMTEILDRLRPHFPPYLTKIDRSEFGHLTFEFTPFTGREAEPVRPSTHHDDRLHYVPEADDEAEHLLREKASRLLDRLFERAQDEWRDAAYVADLRRIVQDAPARWAAYRREAEALDTAYAYLRTPEAATEWPSAVSRLIDAQSRAGAAAAAFDERGQQIADAHDRHVYADLGRQAALTAAGYPEAAEWHIADASSYGRRQYMDWDTHPPLTEQIRCQVEQQDTHLAKVRRLSGTN
ncbi:hypothetical protein PV334_33605 [Streptomyces sp. ME02-7008A-1]|uniref:hypothetical protein n=1 Tax=Streptomyces TaxID=1883 RepID=UPI0029B936D4|nr:MULTISPECIES: hypothetical protein [unclassified Streptomyces]MDX3186178.1 hypothetical protein [Streptomyces sp. ME02-7008A-1]MDX3307083.1 hypothetical protein [Streptomyces sp. ME02-7008A]